MCKVKPEQQKSGRPMPGKQEHRSLPTNDGAAKTVPPASVSRPPHPGSHKNDNNK